MFRFSIRRFCATNASGREAVEQQFGKKNFLTRFSARMADKLAKRRKIDDLADYVDQDLRFEYHSSFEYAMGGFTLVLMAIPMYLVTEGYTPPSKVTVWTGMLSQKEYDDTWKSISDAGVPWWMSSVGHASLFFVIYQFTPYVRYPFYVHVMAPFWAKMGWTTHRYELARKLAEKEIHSQSTKKTAGAATVNYNNNGKKTKANRGWR